MTVVLIFFLTLSILILVHEFGHFLTARAFGVFVEEFALGLPFTKPLLTRQLKNGLKLSIYPILFGGFVKLFGEDEEPRGAGQKKTEAGRLAFWEISPLKRGLVISAGVIGNFLLAVVLISFIFTQGVLVQGQTIRITQVAENSPAQEAGFLKGDIVKTFSLAEDKNPIPVSSLGQLIDFTKEHAGEEIEITLAHCQTRKNPDDIFSNCLDPLTTRLVKAVPRGDPPAGQGALGIAITDLEEKTYPLYQAPVKGIVETVKITWLIILAFKDMGIGLMTRAQVPPEVAGPVGIAQLTGQAARAGSLAVVQLVSLLSLNLAILNILPFPALDGGRLAFVALELLTGRKLVKARYERWAHLAGMIFLFILLILITYRDLNRLLHNAAPDSPF